MDSCEYVKNAVVTESRDFSAIHGRLSGDAGMAIRLLHSAVGLSTEVGEFACAVEDAFQNSTEPDYTNIAEEIGDMLWYCALGSDALGVGFQQMLMRTQMHPDAQHRFSILSLVDSECNNSILVQISLRLQVQSGQFLDYLKRHVFYGAPLEESLLVQFIGHTLWMLDHVGEALRLDLSAIMEKNIEKLRNRYPDQFTEQAALNRDLAAERKVLEREAKK